MFRNLYHYWLIYRSGTFDREFYLLTYSDVRRADVNPLWHFVKIGWKERRNPSKDFDTDFYLSKYKDVKKEGINPLVHYLKFGQKEGRQVSPHDKEDLKRFCPSSSTNKDKYKITYEAYLRTANSVRDTTYIADLPKDDFFYRDQPKLIAFYLPQFHPIPENDLWWEKGFTEWTNVSKAVPQFVSHSQPHLPGELGFYDLRVPEVQEKQVKIAKKFGIYGFCFHFYWFNGQRLLDKPLNLFINNKNIDFPFCVCWANENWTRRWDGRENEILISQEHTFENDKKIIEDFTKLFQYPNYIRIDERPLLVIYRPDLLNEPNKTIAFWRKYSQEKGLGNPYILAAQTFGYSDPTNDGFDGALEFPPHNVEVNYCVNDHLTLLNDEFNGYVFEYRDFATAFMNHSLDEDYKTYKTVSPGWDNSPRRLSEGLIFRNSSPELYGKWLEKACEFSLKQSSSDDRMVFINAWNEWAEGAYLEPDRKFGYAYLQKTREILENLHSSISNLNDGNSYQNKYDTISEKWPYYSEEDFKEINHKYDKKIALAIDNTIKNVIISDDSKPIASIIIPMYNHLNDTLNCLKSICECKEKTPFEIILVDDNSTDATYDVLSKCENLTYIRNEKNSGFLESCNMSAQHANGDYLVFLNNDTVVLPGWLDELINTFTIDSDAGLVGSKLIYPNGKLQEAGGVVFRDGSAMNFGRDGDPNKPQFNYVREVDYCSGACICVPKNKWIELNGFDELYLPAYYEDTDFAFRIRQKSYKVLYQPFSQVIHIEGATSGTDTSKGIKHYQIINQEKFYERWKSVLQSHNLRSDPEISYRNTSRKKHVLVIDVCTPKPDQDSGSIDTYNYLLTLRKLGFEVTFISVVDPEKVDKYVIDLQKHGVECIYEPYLGSIENHLEYFGKFYDLIFLFRAPSGGKYIDDVKKYAPQAKIVFNTVDLHHLREKREREILQKSDTSKIQQEGVSEEIELSIMRKADKTILVSEYEYKLLKDIRDIDPIIIPLPREIPGRLTEYEDRRDILFIGGFLHKPNVDAVQYFSKEIWPMINTALPKCNFLVGGSNIPQEIHELEGGNIHILGFIPDLDKIFSCIRLTIAPLRYGAGVKGKVLTSLGYGVPCIVTPIAAEGMGATHREHIMIADSPNEFAKCVIESYREKELWEALSINGLSFMKNSFSINKFKNNLENLINQLGLEIND